MEIQNTLAPECCAVRFNAGSKDEAVRGLARLAAKSPACSSIDENHIYEVLAKREAQGSTAFGNEVALPHARVEGLTRFLVFVAVSARGVPFDALDKKRVHLFFVILGPPENVNQHLRILATISRLVAHTRIKKELRAARSVETLVESIVRNLGTPDTAVTAPREEMKLVLINLYVEEYLHDILQLLLEHGIDGATVLDSSGMGRYISNVPIFAEFIGFMQERKHYSKTILTLVPESQASRLIEGIERVTGDLETHEGAAVIVLGVSLFKGTMKML